MDSVSTSMVTLFVETGVHAGAVQRLAPGAYRLGSDLGADIVLAGERIEAFHLLLEIDRRSLRLEPLQGALIVDGEKNGLQPGDERRLPLPARFTIGGASVRITAPKDAALRRRRTALAVVAAGLLVLAATGLHVLNRPVDADDGTGPTATVAHPANGASPAKAAPPVAGNDDRSMAPPEVTLDQAAAMLRARLSEHGLDDIQVKTETDRLVADGEAEPSRMDDWRQIRMDFDRGAGRKVLLIANVVAADLEEPPLLEIEAVWFGDRPHLIAGGSRFFVGSPIGDGWRITAIGREDITFARGERTFSLTL